jgi:hypothetical protein
VCEVPQHGGARGRLLPQLQQPEEMAAATSCSRQRLITLPAYGMLEATVLAFSRRLPAVQQLKPVYCALAFVLGDSSR